jgi:hypothetical protein
VSPTSIGFSFRQLYGSSADYGTGSGTVNFTALDDSLYTISDVLPEGLNPGLSGFTAFLENDTTHTTPYVTFGGDGLTGELIAGDTYTFSGYAGVGDQVTGAVLYSPSITFTPEAPTVTPEPSSLMLLGTGLLGACGAIRRKFCKA